MRGLDQVDSNLKLQAPWPTPRARPTLLKGGFRVSAGSTPSLGAELEGLSAWGRSAVFS